MPKWLDALFSRKAGGEAQEAPDVQAPAPDEISLEGLSAFPIAKHVSLHAGFPIVDWSAVASWVESIESEELQSRAWDASERGWFLHAREALGPQFRIAESENTLLLSSLAPELARATLEYVERTRKRMMLVLQGIAEAPPLGKTLMIVFDDEDSYYNYVSHYYPEEGEFAFSAGMHIDAGCSHFVTAKSDLRSIEQVIAHEMTHGCLSHLPIPAWLNEGIAVNTERRLAGRTPSHYSPSEIREKHLAFWGVAEIQEFWSGKSFRRSDDGNMLSYDLASVMVEQMAKDWERFQRFVVSADRADSGAAAARAHLHADLGEIVCALLETEAPDEWAPRPAAWPEEPEKGGFRLTLQRPASPRVSFSY